MKKKFVKEIKEIKVEEFKEEPKQKSDSFLTEESEVIEEKASIISPEKG